jgi:hypothetical protein
MPKVAAFHSNKDNNTTDPFHDNSQCGAGSEVPPHNKVQGTGNRRHCGQCAKLNSEGK